MTLLLFMFVFGAAQLLLTSAANIINDISFSNLQFEPAESSSAFPQNAWKASVDFELTNPTNIQTNDYFTINMPKVYQAYYNYPELYFNISMNDIPVFQCFPEQQAYMNYNETIMTCASYVDFAEENSLSGSLNFAFTFNCGGGNIVTGFEIDDASYFESGVSQWFEFSDSNGNTFGTSVTFDTMDEPEDLFNVGRNPVDETLEIYYAAPKCSSGHITSGFIQYLLEPGTQFDTTYNLGGVSNDSTHNEFYMLNASDSAMFVEPTTFIQNGQFGLKLNFADVKTDEIIWFDVIQSVGPETTAVSNTYQAIYTCASGTSTWSEMHNTLTVIEYMYVTNQGTIVNAPTVTTTTTSTWNSGYATTTTAPIITPSGAKTISVTVDVNVPLATETITQTNYWASSYATTTTAAIDTVEFAEKGTVTVTVDVELPTPVFTTTSVSTSREVIVTTTSDMVLTTESVTTMVHNMTTLFVTNQVTVSTPVVSTLTKYNDETITSVSVSNSTSTATIFTPVDFEISSYSVESFVPSLVSSSVSSFVFSSVSTSVPSLSTTRVITTTESVSTFLNSTTSLSLSPMPSSSTASIMSYMVTPFFNKQSSSVASSAALTVNTTVSPNLSTNTSSTTSSIFEPSFIDFENAAPPQHSSTNYLFSLLSAALFMFI